MPLPEKGFLSSSVLKSAHCLRGVTPLNSLLKPELSAPCYLLQINPGHFQSRSLSSDVFMPWLLLHRSGKPGCPSSRDSLVGTGLIVTPHPEVLLESWAAAFSLCSTVSGGSAGKGTTSSSALLWSLHPVTLSSYTGR